MELQRLTACGIDYEDGLKRFSMNQKIYEKHLRKFVSLTLIDEIEDAINRCELKEAFEACHKLKAYVGNLSMPVLFDVVCDLTEWLREGRTNVLNEKFRLVKEEY
ncbi:MAG: hypothetical protein Q4B70_17720, partial [Lachnospiraceae bacterium]|nr:hypothetical protein [Lachnospiraceae bacterium]